MKILLRISLFILLAIVARGAHAATIHSECDGAWTDPLTWQEEVLPAPDDTIIISNKIRLQSDLALENNFLQIQKSGELCGFVELEVDSDSRVDVAGSLNVNRLEIGGDVYLYGSIRALVISINGGALHQAGGNVFINFFECSEATDTCAVVAGNDDGIENDLIIQNPFRSVIHVRFPALNEAASYIVTDIKGRIIRQGSIPGRGYTEYYQINVEGYPRGIYFLQLIFPDNRHTIKLVKL